MWEADAAKVAEALKQTITGTFVPDTVITSLPPPVRVIDCVLSLRNRYLRVVRPRVLAFHARHPNVTTITSLLATIDESGGADCFITTMLSMNSPMKGRAIVAVSQYLNDMQHRFAGMTEADRLHAWALWARPGDYLALDVRGFGLAGFQYLRMLFGADTAKPDVHIVQFVSRAVGREVSASQALYILERAAEICDRSLRQLDNLIWEKAQE